MAISDTQYPLPLPPLERWGAEDFMVTDSNREAAQWIATWPDWPSFCLVLSGPEGAGKTHLTKLWRARSKAEPVEAVRWAQVREGVEHLVLDDADAAMGEAEAEENLFHLYNRAKETGRFLLITGKSAPAAWGVRLPDLRSRLLAAHHVALQAPDDTLLGAMLIKQFQDRQITVEAGVMDYLLPRIERSPAALREMVEGLDRLSLSAGRGITIALVRAWLEQRGKVRARVPE